MKRCDSVTLFKKQLADKVKKIFSLNLQYLTKKHGKRTFGYDY